MEEGTLYDVVIIGAGPAGLTAAIYTGRALLSTLVLEKTVPGGQLNETEFVENYPGFEEKVAAAELMDQMRKQAERMGPGSNRLITTIESAGRKTRSRRGL